MSMYERKNELKVVIVGGGVARLSLANMLEKASINYSLLEAHPDLAPQVGASIALLPNGLRILDQLGCYHHLEEASESIRHKLNIRGQGGKILSRGSNLTFTAQLEKRYVMT